MTQIIENIPIWVLIGVPIIAYIVAYIFSKNTECVILYKWYDYWALILFAVSPLIALGLQLITGQSGEGTEDSSVFLSTTCKILMGISVVVMFVTSIIANIGHGWKSLLYIFISILAKVPFIMGSFIVAFSLYCVFNAGAGAKDGRYRDGTKGNKRIKALGVFFAIFTPLVFKLIKPEEYQYRVMDRLRGKVERR